MRDLSDRDVKPP